ncbi:MAG: hypothetical protein ABIC57_04245 [bacterium]
MTRSRTNVSSAALASLGVVTDSRFITILPTSLLPDVEITGIQVLEDPVVVGTFAKVWVHLKANAPSPPILGDFCRIIDNDTEVIVGVKKNWTLVTTGDEWIAKYDGIDDWNTTMPNKTWNLRIEAGTN